MVKKTITYMNPFTEQQVTEEHYFHISKADLIEMELEEHAARYEKDGETLTGMQAHLAKIVDSQDAPAVLAEFKAILRRAYGVKQGDRFVKSPEVWAQFEGSEAYSELVFQLLTNADELGKFVSSIIPGNLEQIAAEIAARAEAEEADGRRSAMAEERPLAEVAAESSDANATVPPEPAQDPTGLSSAVTPRVLTRSEAIAMGSEELQAGLRDGRYKLS